MNKKKVDQIVNQMPPQIKHAIETIRVDENLAVFVAIGGGIDTLDNLTREFGEYPLWQINELLQAGLIEYANIRPFVCKVQWTPFGVDVMNKLYDVVFPKVRN